MRLIGKLLALVLLCGIFQTMFEVTAAVMAFINVDVAASFTDQEARTMATAQERFDSSSVISRWVVKGVLAMPYGPVTFL